MCSGCRSKIPPRIVSSQSVNEKQCMLQPAMTEAPRADRGDTRTAVWSFHMAPVRARCCTTRPTSLHAHLHVYIAHTRSITPLRPMMGRTPGRTEDVHRVDPGANHTSTTKLFPQNGQRRVASRRSLTTLLLRAKLGSTLDDPPTALEPVPCGEYVMSPRPRSPCMSPPVGSAADMFTAEEVRPVEDRNALRLQPMHVRTFGVASMYEVTQQRAVARAGL